MILHVTVPNEKYHFARHNCHLRIDMAVGQILNVEVIASVEAKQLERKLANESMVAEAASLKVLFCDS